MTSRLTNEYNYGSGRDERQCSSAMNVTKSLMNERTDDAVENGTAFSHSDNCGGDKDTGMHRDLSYSPWPDDYD